MKSFDEWLAYQNFTNLSAEDLVLLRDVYDKIRATTQAGRPEDLKGRFCDLATQYYVAGRSAAVAHLAPIYGNLLHHAVEMFLKTALVGVLSLKKMRSKEYGHNLEALWKEFKAKEADPALDPFDTTISTLNLFENLRYPDKTSDAALLIAITWDPGDAVEAYGTVAASAQKYEVFISDVDRLVLEVMKRISLNPKYFTGMVGPSGRQAIQFRNPHAADWLTPGPDTT
jgi:hypothetical protein